MLTDLLRHKNKQRYLVFDFESSGLNLFDSMPWQLSFLVCEGKEIKEEYDYFINISDLQMSQEAAKITNFSWDKYNKLKRDKNEVLEKFESYLYNPEYINLGHNILRFDVYIHNTLRRICGKGSDYSYLSRLIDTNCLAKSVKLGITKSKDDTLLQWQYRLANHYKRPAPRTNLKQMLKENSIEFDESKLHDSLYDVQMNWRYFAECLLYQVEI